MDTGWIKLYRKLLESQYGRNLEMIGLFAALLLKATHKENFTHDGTRLSPGQLICSKIGLANEFKISEMTLHRKLEKLKNAGWIDVQSSNKNTIISIVNWSEYQSGDGQVEDQVRNKRGTSGEQVRTFKNVKNVKNEKKELLYQNESQPSDSWCQEFVALFDDPALVAWLKSGNNQKAQTRILKTYRPEAITRFTERAFEWKKSARKSRQASTFLETWMEKESQKDDSILRSVLTEDERYELALKYWGPGIED